MALFSATAYKRRITDITAKELSDWGIRCLLLDVDNTLTTHDNPHLTDAVRAWLDARVQEGMHLAIVSNNRYPRVAPFAERIGLSFTPSAKKPLPFGFRRAAASEGIPADACLVIGDQIFTDIVGANLAGMRSVQVMPIEMETKQRFIRFKRRLEAPILRRIFKKRGITL